MSTINDLSVTSSVSSDDKIPLWQNANGVTRALPVSVFDSRYLTQADIALLAASAAVETFSAGADFTPGVTISLTLANEYLSKSNIEVFFDPLFQGPDQYTLVGTSLAFISAIPLGVQNVYVRGGATRIVGAPSDGTVTTPKIVDQAVTTAKLDDGAVTDIKVAPGSKLLNRIKDTVSVKDFGAIGDGVADDTTAVQAAITFALATSQRVYAPGGTYLLTQQISGSGAVVIDGDGIGNTMFKWPATAASSGFRFSIASNSVGLATTCGFFGFTLATSAFNVGTALEVDCPGSLSGDRITPRVIVRDVACRGYTNPLVDGWNQGLYFNNCVRTLVSSYYFWGAQTGQSTFNSASGVNFNNAIGASPHPTEYTLENSYITGCANGAIMSDFEGGIIRGNQIYSVGTAVFITSPGANFAHILIDGNYLNAQVSAIVVQYMFEAIISNNLIYLQLSAASGNGIAFSNGAQFFTVRGNTFENYNQTTSMNGVVVSAGCGSGIVDGNLFRRCDSIDTTSHGVGIWLVAGSTNVVVGRTNSFTLTNTTLLDSGTSNNVATTTPGAVGWTTNSDGLTEQWGSSVVTLDASGNGTVTLPKQFRSAVYAPVVCNGDPSTLATSYFIANQSATTTTTLAFSVRPNPGALPCRVNWRVSGV